MNEKQAIVYQTYLDKRSLSMKPKAFEPLLKLYNELFGKSINPKEFTTSKGFIHKVSKIELKLDKHYKTK